MEEMITWLKGDMQAQRWMLIAIAAIALSAYIQVVELKSRVDRLEREIRR